MKKQTTKLMALVLCVLMFVSLLPSMAFAAETTSAPYYGKLAKICGIAEHLIAEIEKGYATSPAPYIDLYGDVENILNKMRTAVTAAKAEKWETLSEARVDELWEKISAAIDELNDKDTRPIWPTHDVALGTANSGYAPVDYKNTVISVTPSYGDDYLTGLYGSFPGDGHKVTASLSDGDNFEMTFGLSTYIMPVNNYQWPWYTVQPKGNLEPGTYMTTLVITIWEPPLNIAILTCITVNYIFTVEANTCTVSFLDWDGSLIDVQTVEYGKNATAPADPAREGYTFTNWDKDFSNITSDLTVTAQYKINYYYVTFLVDGKAYDVQSVTFGGAAADPVQPYKENYTFVGWDSDYSYITEDLTVTAIFESVVVSNAKVTSFNKNLQDKNNQNLRFTVEMTLSNGEVFTIDHAEKVNGQQKGNKTFTFNTPYGSYSVFVAWNDNNTVTTCEVREVKSAGDSNIQNNVNTYTVTFVVDGTIVNTQTVEDGKTVKIPANPSKKGYTFDGWELKFNKVTGDLTMIATWKSGQGGNSQ